MKLKLILTSLLMLITITMSYFLRLLLRIYRIYAFIGPHLTPKDLENLQTIIRYQNIIWILIFIIIAGLIALICIDNKTRISRLLRKF